MDYSDARIDVKAHAVCVPFPVQSHLNAMLNVAKLLHQRGFHISFVNTEYNHRRRMKCRGPNSVDGLSDFQFKTIPDSMPQACDADAPQDIPTLCVSSCENFFAPFCSLLSQLHDDANSSDQNNTSVIPPVSCIIGDGLTSFTIQAAAQFDIPILQFWPVSSCGLLSIIHLCELVDRGITPLKDESYLTNGYLETTIDWIPGMKNIRLKHLPSFARVTDPNDILLNFVIQESERTLKSSAIILNTFDALEQEVLDVLSSLLPPIYTIGPLHLFTRQTKDENLETIAANLWKENPECINWLNSKEPNSVIYVNFGSVIVLQPHHLIEFAWGLANSGKHFLWIIRPDLVRGDSAILPSDFLEKTQERGMIASWCAQEEVLKHQSIAGFLTHSGWNSVIESISAGVPMISWPFFAEQPTNCRYCCVEWGIALEIDCNVKRHEVENCVKELMEGKKGEDMKRKVMELKSKAEESCKPGGSSHHNLHQLIAQILQSN